MLKILKKLFFRFLLLCLLGWFGLAMGAEFEDEFGLLCAAYSS